MVLKKQLPIIQYTEELGNGKIPIVSLGRYLQHTSSETGTNRKSEMSLEPHNVHMDH